MRYAATIIKAICLFLLIALFILFLVYAINFGQGGDQYDLIISNLLVSAMISVLIISGLSALVFDFYERNKWQNEKLFNELSEKITKLDELESKVNSAMTENLEKAETIFNNLSQKLEENSAQTQDFMTQFANLSVQVFSKEKQEHDMQHSENLASSEQMDVHNDYFNHYTNEPLSNIDETPDYSPEPENTPVELEPEYTPVETEPEYTPVESELKSTPVETEPENDITILQADNKISELSSDIEFPQISENEVETENVNSVDDLLQNQTDDTEQKNEEQEDKLSEIFNPELADTLADLEIMQDEDNSTKTHDVDLSSYFENAEKVKL